MLRIVLLSSLKSSVSSSVGEQGGQRELLLGVDDGFITENRWRSIPRADVAELSIQAVTLDQAKNRCVSVRPLVYAILMMEALRLSLSTRSR